MKYAMIRKCVSCNALSANSLCEVCCVSENKDGWDQFVQELLDTHEKLVNAELEDLKVLLNTQTTELVLKKYKSGETGKAKIDKALEKIYVERKHSISAEVECFHKQFSEIDFVFILWKLFMRFLEKRTLIDLYRSVLSALAYVHAENK